LHIRCLNEVDLKPLKIKSTEYRVTPIMSLVNCAVVLISLVCLIPAVLCYDDNFDDLVSVTEHAPTSWSKHGEPCYEDNGQLCDIKESLACVNK